MKPYAHRRLSLTVLFSFAVFVIFIVAALIVVAAGSLAISLGMVARFKGAGMVTLAFVALVASVLVGTGVSLLAGRIPLRPIRKIIAATNRLAEGDFSTRLNFTHPPEFRALSESFNRMASELGAIELLRADFINNFSHEFKTPIVSIKGFAQVLKRGDLPPETRQTYLDVVIRESERLAALATNVLNLSKIENQSILSEKKSFELGEEVRRCVLILQSAWEAKGLALEVDVEDMRYTGNEEMLDQVFLNLLDNAVKFTPQGGTIFVGLTRDARAARFTLRDSGRGIEEGDIDRIFEKFYRANDARGAAGNGLGLAVAQKIVALHGGAIACESAPGAGTAFTVTLPFD